MVLLLAALSSCANACLCLVLLYPSNDKRGFYDCPHVETQPLFFNLGAAARWMTVPSLGNDPHPARSRASALGNQSCFRVIPDSTWTRSVAFISHGTMIIIIILLCDISYTLATFVGSLDSSLIADFECECGGHNSMIRAVFVCTFQPKRRVRSAQTFL